MNVEENTQEETTTEPTKKQRVLEARGKEVPIDLFLYSCLEQERLEKALAAPVPGIQYPLLSDPKFATDLETAARDTQLAKLCKWYSDKFPELTSNRKIDHEQLAEVIPAFVAMCRDINDLQSRMSGSPLPAWPAENETSVELWSAVETAIAGHFSSNQHLFTRYLHWAHGKESIEEFIPGSRPPVGRYAPPPPPRAGGREGRPGRPDRAGSRGDNRPARGDRGDHKPRSSKPNRQSVDSRPSREDKRRPNEGKRHRGPENEEQTAKLREKALAEVADAISSLQNDSSVHEVTLKPTNSFYRRIQHQEIVDAGFVSNSVGEGAERAVQITRKQVQ